MVKRSENADRFATVKELDNRFVIALRAGGRNEEVMEASGSACI